ncbi:MAG: molybdenum ABC transporter ATP-binding protein [Rhodoferax sp.]|nr:molybdenum ABC transporter ATP-binding protein [Rhodoferax sp.]
MSQGIANDLHLRLQLARTDFVLDVDLPLPGESITVLFGASGCGKTTLLRCVAGLERAATAYIRIGTQIWQDSALGIFVPTHRRALGYVFQEASLFAHLDVRGNLEYGLRRVRGLPQHTPLDAAVALLGLDALLTRKPEQLSGGERQRVAIARALCTQPQLLLLDEPLASLDPARRQDILPWLERLRRELHIPMLYVTHSVEELARLADTLVVLQAGCVLQAGPVAQVLAQLETPVLPTEDTGALLEAQLVARDSHWHLMQVAFAGGSLWLDDTGHAIGTPLRLRVLARDVSIATQAPQHSSIQNLLPCVIEAMQPDAHPSQLLLRLLCGTTILLARITARAAHTLGLQRGMPVWAQVKAVALVG